MKELGNKVGVSESAIGLYELEKRKISSKMLMKLADALDCSINEILTGKNGGIVASYTPYRPADDETETFDEAGNSSGATKKAPPAEAEDAELAALLEDLRTRPDMRMLFKLAHGATAEDVRQAVKIIEALRKE